MLTGIHFLLTYLCTFECDHCFLYCGPHSKGTFTLAQLKKIFKEIEKIKTIETVYFEGGEPFLFYPLMLAGVEIAHSMDLEAGIVTNAYWATSVPDAEIWLEPLVKAGLSSLSLSDDAYHHEEEKDNPAKKALAAAQKLGMDVSTICIEKPTVETDVKTEEGKGTAVIGGGAMFKGRAVEKLTTGLPRRPFSYFNSCPHEELENPKRVHVDAYGHVHICQGLSMGNMWETPLSELVKNYDAACHPICGPLMRGGPALLAKEYNVDHEDTYVDECHFCFLTRLALIDRFPQYLAPRQVYGLE
jgi:organic radical activating enzyme